MPIKNPLFPHLPGQWPPKFGRHQEWGAMFPKCTWCPNEGGVLKNVRIYFLDLERLLKHLKKGKEQSGAQLDSIPFAIVGI